MVPIRSTLAGYRETEAEMGIGLNTPRCKDAREYLPERVLLNKLFTSSWSLCSFPLLRCLSGKFFVHPPVSGLDCNRDPRN